MIQITGLLFWLGIIPFCIGLIPASFISEDRRDPGFLMAAGYFTMWALYGVVTIPVVLFVKYDNFILASNCFMVLSILCAAAGAGLMYRRRRKAVGDHRIRDHGRMSFAEYMRQMSWAERTEWLLFLALLGFQLYRAAAYASFDGDDAYYVVESLIAQQADTMYSILPYTGRHTGLDIRHALAVFPMWIAFVADKSHIHATILSHTILPLILIPLSYLVYYEIGRVLFREKPEADIRSAGSRENLPVFMILMAMFQIFGNVSIYTNETFFLTRTWQGKAVAGSLVIPALLWLFLLLYQDRDRQHIHSEAEKTNRQRQRPGMTKTDGRDIRFPRAGLWLLLVCVNMTAGICSSIAVFLVSVLMAATALCLAVVERDYKVLIRMGAVCIPNVVYVLAYVIIGYGGLLS